MSIGSFNNECPLTLVQEALENKYSISCEPNGAKPLKLYISVDGSRFELEETGKCNLQNKKLDVLKC